MSYSYNAAREEVTFALGNRDDIATRVDHWLDSAQTMLAWTTLSFPNLETTVQNVTLVAGQPNYDLTMFPQFIDFQDLLGILLVKNQNTGLKMWRFGFSDLRALVNQASGDPNRWTRRGNQFYVDPIPISTTHLQIDYRRRPRPGMSELGEQFHEVWIDTAVWIGARRLGMDDTLKTTIAAMPAIVLAQLSQPRSHDDFEMYYNDASVVVAYHENRYT